MSRFGNLEFGDQFEGESTHQSPSTDEQLFMEKARNAFEDGQFETGLRCYAKVLEFNPKNCAAWTGQVRMLVELGEFHEAKVWADKALEQFPTDPELLASKAVALGRLGDLKAALAFSDAAVEERGDTPYVWLARGDVLMARKEKRAEYCFEKARLIAPQDWFVQWLSARIRFYYRKFALAMKHAQQALALDSARAVVWFEVAKCQEALGMAGMARTSFEQVLQLDPRCHEAEVALNRVSSVGLWGSFRSWWQGLFFR
jgi:tetratricopeptide (TPR) repeat protein